MAFFRGDEGPDTELWKGNWARQCAALVQALRIRDNQLPGMNSNKILWAFTANEKLIKLLNEFDCASAAELLNVQSLFGIFRTLSFVHPACHGALTIMALCFVRRASKDDVEILEDFKESCSDSKNQDPAFKTQGAMEQTAMAAFCFVTCTVLGAENGKALLLSNTQCANGIAKDLFMNKKPSSQFNNNMNVIEVSCRILASIMHDVVADKTAEDESTRDLKEIILTNTKEILDDVWTSKKMDEEEKAAIKSVLPEERLTKQEEKSVAAWTSRMQNLIGINVAYELQKGLRLLLDDEFHKSKHPVQFNQMKMLSGAISSFFVGAIVGVFKGKTVLSNLKKSQAMSVIHQNWVLSSLVIFSKVLVTRQ